MSKPLTAHQKHVAHQRVLHQKHIAHLKHIGAAIPGHGAQHVKKQVPKKPSAKKKTASGKKATAGKKSGHAVAKAKGRTSKRALSLRSELSCCVIEAISASLSLSGLIIADDDMLRLFWEAGGDPDDGVAIPDMLMTLTTSGLVSCQLEQLDLDDIVGLAPAILGLSLPAPHAVLATPDGWWSWGALFSPQDFPGAIIEEAWAVRWDRSGSLHRLVLPALWALAHSPALFVGEMTVATGAPAELSSVPECCDFRPHSCDGS